MKKIINLAFEKYIILLFLTIYAIFINYIYDLADYKLVADASSYLYFSFENLNVFFSQHRSFLFPLILNTDPICKHLNIKSDTLVKIIRPSKTSGEYVLYRYCI